MKSLKLNNEWDLELNAIGDITIVEDDLDLVQAVSTAVRLFQKDFIYDEDLGIPYIEEILGQTNSSAFYEPYIRQEASRIAGVANIELIDIAFNNRELIANIQITKE